MWHQAGARAMHRKLRSQGRIPGMEGRNVIASNRAIRAEQRRREKIAQLSATTTGLKGPDGLTREQLLANDMLKEQWAQEEAARVERVQAEWLEKQARLNSPTPSDSAARVGRTWSSMQEG